eukprot:SAG25_NODE_6917_length_519_cov_0.695238_1_plen_26_part_10
MGHVDVVEVLVTSGANLGERNGVWGT